MANNKTQLVITPSLPKGPPVWGILGGFGVLAPAANGASGGWQVVDRPKQKAILQWYDAPPLELVFTFVLDGGSGPRANSVETLCNRLVSWLYPRPGDMQPPVLSVSGPVSKQALLIDWVLYTFKEVTSVRNADGERIQQSYAVTLYEYTPATASVLKHLTPAQSAQVALTSVQSQTSRQIYTVRPGDTLQRIAANVLGNYTLAPQIAALNGIRDPHNLAVGRRLVIP